MRHARSIASAIVDAFVRTLSFALLILALLSYCGLPSNPPDNLFRSTWLQLAGADPDANSLLVAPSQAKEHRAKDALDDDPPAATKHAARPPAAACVAIRFPARTHDDGADEPRLLAMPHARPPSRAPPRLA